MGNVKEFFSPSTAKAALKDREEREQYPSIIDALDLTTARSSIKESLKSHSVINLGSGTYGGFVADKAATHIKGVSTGAIVGSKATFRAEAAVEGLTFSNVVADNVDSDELVSLSASSSVVFRGCRFRKRTTASPTFVQVADGATAVFIGCVFEGGPGTGSIFSHTGLATSVVLVGCSNKTAGASYGGRVQGPTDQMLSGSTTIAAGATSSTVTLTSAYDAKPVLVTAAAQPTNAQAKPLSGVVAGGTLTITAQAAPGGSGWPVYYLVDGR